MSATCQKHRLFVSEPMGDKPVTELAGIGEELGVRLAGLGYDKTFSKQRIGKVQREKLIEKGFDKAYIVLGQFLVLKKNEEMFREWLENSASSKQSEDCYNCLKEWCDAYL